MSLVEGKDRLANSIVFTFTQDGKLLNTWKGATVINSNSRLTYADAQAALDGGASPHEELIQNLSRFGRYLREERQKRGQITFPPKRELKLKKGDDGKETFEEKPLVEANSLVEDWMVFANEIAGERLQDARKKEKLPGFFRIHEAPDLDALRDAAKQLGEDWSVGIIDSVQSGKPYPWLKKRLKDLPIENYVMNRLLMSLALPAEEVRALREAAAAQYPDDAAAAEKDASARIRQAEAARSRVRLPIIQDLMEKARFDTKDLGHFGLAAGWYSQFTSPMRRFGDLIVELLDRERQYRDQGRKTTTYNQATEKELADIADHLTNREILADRAERRALRMILTERLKGSEGKSIQVKVIGPKQIKKKTVGIICSIRIPGTRSDVRYQTWFEDLEGFPTDTGEIRALRDKTVEAVLIAADVGRANVALRFVSAA
jgi:ribonuclease R